MVYGVGHVIFKFIAKVRIGLTCKYLVFKILMELQSVQYVLGTKCRWVICVQHGQGTHFEWAMLLRNSQLCTLYEKTLAILTAVKAKIYPRSSAIYADRAPL